MALKFKSGQVVQWRGMNDKVFYDAEVVSQSDDKFVLWLSERPDKIPEAENEVVVRNGIEDYFTQVMDAGSENMTLRPVQSEQRRFFRVEDSFPIILRRFENGTPPRKASIFPVYGIEVGELKEWEFEEGVNKRMWKALQGINSKLGLIVYSIEIMEAATPDENENPHVWSMLDTIDRKLSALIQELNIEKTKLIRAESRKVNLSAAGIRFLVEEKLSKGDKVEAKIVLPSSPPIGIVTLGKVVRAVETEDGRYDIALDYSDMDPSVREEIIHYVLQRQREIIRSQREVLG